MISSKKYCFNEMMLFLLKLILISELLGVIQSRHLVNETSRANEDVYVFCDKKTYPGNRTSNPRNVCKVECYTKLNNPGFCQTKASACKTLEKDLEPIKCKQGSGQSEAPVCCPFKLESIDNSINDNRHYECGKRPDIAAIVGGIDAQPNTWPWMVSVYERDNPRSKPRFICGGSIIHENYILSAAHCFVRFNKEKIKSSRFLVKVGGHRISDPNIPFLEISDIIVHKNYDINRHYYDIALVKTKYKMEFMPTVAPICLPKKQLFKEKTFVGHKTKLVGWGATRFGGAPSDRLKEVEVEIIDNKFCNKSYTDLFGSESMFPQGINHMMICAGFTSGGKDSCQGDSGGPLAVENDKRWHALGIVSFGYKCAEPNYPGIYTKITEFMDWIESFVKFRRLPEN